LKRVFALKICWFYGNWNSALGFTTPKEGVLNIGLNYPVIKMGSEYPYIEALLVFLHEFIHVYQITILNYYRKFKETKSRPLQGGLKEAVQKFFHDEMFKKALEVINNSIPIKAQEKARAYLKETIPFLEERQVFLNPYLRTETKDKAGKLYKDFNRHEPDKILKINIPLNEKSKLVKLGFIDNLEYLSDKMIFEQDKKTRKRKERTYIHSFRKYNKKPILFTNEAGNLLIIYDPVHKIQVKKEGII
ncbi:MAG: hypothetical protein WC466_10585, partial [Candidatus Izemoplasmatales bacterium]